jgi:hypothetical protein
MIAVNVPAAKPTVTSSSATTAADPRPWRFVTSRSSTARFVAVSMLKRIGGARGGDQSTHDHSSG